MGTLATSDDKVPAFAQHGNLLRLVDVIAPATHLLSLRVPGSWSTQNNPAAIVGDRFLRGSGTTRPPRSSPAWPRCSRQQVPHRHPRPDQGLPDLDGPPDRPAGQRQAGLGGLGSLTGLSGLGLGTNPITSHYAGNGVVTATPAVAAAPAGPGSVQLDPPGHRPRLASTWPAAPAAGSSTGPPLAGPLTLLGLSHRHGWHHRRRPAHWDGNRWTGNRWTDGSLDRQPLDRQPLDRQPLDRPTAGPGNRWTGNRWTAGTWS